MVERTWQRVRTALRSLLRRRRFDADVDEELRFHAEQMFEAAVARGEDPAEARLQVRRHMGSASQVQEACRDERPLRLVDDLLQDLRFGVRLLGRDRGFATVAVLSLALGIGASTSIVSVINAVVLRSLPVAGPDELRIAQIVERGGVEQLFSYPAVDRASRLLAGRAEVAAHSSIESALVTTWGDGGEGPGPEAAQLQLVAGDFFGALRQRAQVGRLLGPEDQRVIGHPPVAVISDEYWRRRFGRSAGVLDTELVVNGQALTIVGVAAPAFFGTTVDTETPDLWAPAGMQAVLRFAGGYDRSGGDLQKPWPAQPEIAWLRVMLRVPKGGDAAAAQAMTLALHRERPPATTDAAIPVSLVAGARGFSPIRTQITTPLLVLLLAVGMLLALACANIASLLLARSASRTRELSIRLSIGAGRGRLIRQLLAESLLLALAGGACGLLLAFWGSTALLALLTRSAPAGAVDVRPDWIVVIVACATSAATALLFGLLPAVRGTRVAIAECLNAGARSVVGADARRGRLTIGNVLIAGQMAVAVLLLLVAALFVRSLDALLRVDVGYDRGRVLIARIDPRSSGYTAAERPAMYTRVFEALGRLPGVVSVSASTTLFSGRNRGVFAAEGYEPAPGEAMTTSKNWVTPDYFRTVGLSFTRGRGFGPADAMGGRQVSVVSETLARRYFPNQDPIGKRLTWGTSHFASDGFEIVGVVEDARYNDVKDEALNMAYLLVLQSERFAENVQVRVAGDPIALAGAVRTAIGASEPRLAVGTIETLDSRISRSIGVERLLSWLMMVFGGAALGLACLGLYGTIANAVRRRTAELGIRVALGADRAAIRRLFVREALALVLAGAAFGLPLAHLAARALRGLLYGIGPSDPLAYGAAAGVLVVVCAGAAYVPAWRASRLDPVVALRGE